MAVTSGFFPSLNHDRQYDNIDFGRMFDGVIIDGIFAGVGNVFLVSPAGGMDVTVGSGRAWFNHTWTLNDGPLTITIAPNSTASNRYDFICIKVNLTSGVRANSIVVVSADTFGGIGTRFLDPPDTTTQIIYHPLARVTVEPNASTIVAGNITSWIGDGDTYSPYAKAAVDNLDVGTLMAQYNQQFNDWFASLTALGSSQAEILQAEVGQLRSDLTAETTARENAISGLSPLFTTTQVTKSYTIPGNGSMQIRFTHTTPEGYDVAGIIGWNTGNNNVYLMTYDAYSSSAFFAVHNISSATQTATASARIMYIRHI